MKTVKAIYAIRHKESGEFVEANGKSCWKGKGGAKASYWQQGRYSDNRIKFDEQDEYEVVEILDLFKRYSHMYGI